MEPLLDPSHPGPPPSQVCKKIQAHCEESDDFESYRIKGFVAGF